MGINFKTCREKELWEFVAVHLKKKGIDTVLVGGAVVAIYSKGAYRSGDLDFVKTSMFVTKLDETMKELDFIKHGGILFIQIVNSVLLNFLEGHLLV